MGSRADEIAAEASAETDPKRVGDVDRALAKDGIVGRGSARAQGLTEIEGDTV